MKSSKEFRVLIKFPKRTLNNSRFFEYLLEMTKDLHLKNRECRGSLWIKGNICYGYKNRGSLRLKDHGQSQRSPNDRIFFV